MGAWLPGLVAGLAVTAAVFQRELSAWIVSAGLKYFLRDQNASGEVCSQQPTEGGKYEEQQNASAPRITSITFQSISLRFYFRGVEVRLSDGVIVRIGRLSFGFRRLKQMMLRQPLQKGKGKAIVLTVENARVSLPASFLKPSVTINESARATRAEKSSINSHLEGRNEKKAIRLPAAALLCARFVAMEVCDLRVELAAPDQPGTCRTTLASSQHNDDGNGDDPLKDGDCARKAAAAHAATGVRTIELTGMRLVGFASKRSSCLTVRGLI